jgi:transglutaminase-like putative cysteine protease
MGILLFGYEKYLEIDLLSTKGYSDAIVKGFVAYWQVNIEMHLESDNILDYLNMNEIIDYDHKLIVEKCLELEKGTEGEISLIKKIYEFVRDDIHHSEDIGEEGVTCTASEVLEFGHGICCAKSHLLAAMLRFFGIPTGFCYQKLCSSQEDSHWVFMTSQVDKRV